MPVNQSTNTPEQKPLLYFPPQKNKPIRKASKQSIKAKTPKIIPTPKLEDQLLYTSLNSSFSDSLSATHLSLRASSNTLLNILQPFCNYGLFPSALQKIVSSSAKLEQSEILHSNYQLKTPENHMNHQKKIEKMKLLALGQETILQNYMKDKYMSSQKPNLIKDYYKFMRSKLILMQELQELRVKMAYYDVSGSFTEDFNQQEESAFMGIANTHDFSLSAKTMLNTQNLLYDNYFEMKHECFAFIKSILRFY